MVRRISQLGNGLWSSVVYPQSFLIFDGSEVPILETSAGAHVGLWEMQVEAEVGLCNSLPQTLVVRMAGFFGGDEKDKNFVGKFIRHAISLICAGETSYTGDAYGSQRIHGT